MPLPFAAVFGAIASRVTWAGVTRATGYALNALSVYEIYSAVTGSDDQTPTASGAPPIATAAITGSSYLDRASLRGASFSVIESVFKRALSAAGVDLSAITNMAAAIDVDCDTPVKGLANMALQHLCAGSSHGGLSVLLTHFRSSKFKTRNVAQSVRLLANQISMLFPEGKNKDESRSSLYDMFPEYLKDLTSAKLEAEIMGNRSLLSLAAFYSYAQDFLERLDRSDGDVDLSSTGADAKYNVLRTACEWATSQFSDDAGRVRVALDGNSAKNADPRLLSSSLEPELAQVLNEALIGEDFSQQGTLATDLISSIMPILNKTTNFRSPMDRLAFSSWLKSTAEQIERDSL